MAIRLVANSYSQNKAKQYRISIREHSNGYSFSIVDLTNSECVALARFDSFKDMMEDPLVKEEYGEGRVVIDNASYALVPEVLFVEEHAASYLPISSQHQKRAMVAVADISNYSLKGLCNRRGCLELTGIANNVEYLHPLFVMIEKLPTQDIPVVRKQMVFVDVQKEQIHLLVVDDKKILLANTFSVKTKEDVLYFVLLAYQSLGLDCETVPVFLTGECDNELRQSMKEYIREVSLFAPQDIKIPLEWDEEYRSKFALVL